MDEKEKLNELFNYKTSNLIKEKKDNELTEKEILEKKKEIARKYAMAYYKIVEEVLSNPSYLTYSGPISSRDNNNIIGNYNISGDENSSYYSIHKGYFLGIVLKFNENNSIKFNCNEDKEFYDELMINDILYFYGIDIKSRNLIVKNTIYITFYPDKRMLKKNTESWFDGRGIMYTRQRTK